MPDGSTEPTRGDRHRAFGDDETKIVGGIEAFDRIAGHQLDVDLGELVDDSEDQILDLLQAVLGNDLVDLPIAPATEDPADIGAALLEDSARGVEPTALAVTGAVGQHEGLGTIKLQPMVNTKLMPRMGDDQGRAGRDSRSIVGSGKEIVAIKNVDAHARRFHLKMVH